METIVTILQELAQPPVPVDEIRGAAVDIVDFETDLSQASQPHCVHCPCFSKARQEYGIETNAVILLVYIYDSNTVTVDSMN